MIYFQLFWVYLKIGLFSFGGGYAMISFVEYEIVRKHAWIGQAEFTDIIAISQMTPGPIGINTATYVGYTVTGTVFGSIIATFAVCIPSFVIMLAICKFIESYRKNKWFNAALSGIKPVTIGLIAAAAISMINRENFIDYASVGVFVVSFLMSWKLKMNPILVILLAGLFGLFIYL